MDSGELDFYQHDRVCSNTCRSTKIDLSGARVSLSSPTSAEYVPLTPATADGTCGSEPPLRPARPVPLHPRLWKWASPLTPLAGGPALAPGPRRAQLPPSSLRGPGWVAVRVGHVLGSL